MMPLTTCKRIGQIALSHLSGESLREHRKHDSGQAEQNAFPGREPCHLLSRSILRRNSMKTILWATLTANGYYAQSIAELELGGLYKQCKAFLLTDGCPAPARDLANQNQRAPP